MLLQRRLQSLPAVPVLICGTPVTPVDSIRDLGVYIEADIWMKRHISATVRSCFGALRQIRSIRRALSRQALTTLVRALVVSKVDYCNSVLAGISGYLLGRLQSDLNASARLIYSANRSDSITPLLRELHWLKVPECIEFRLYALVYRCLEGSAPSYLAEGIHRTTDNPTRERLRSADTTTLLVPPLRRSTLRDRSFFVAATRAWNALPGALRSATSLSTFRRDLKTVLFWRLFRLID